MSDYYNPETWGTDVYRRFLDKVNPVENGCHFWTAYRTPDGYGQFWLYIKNIYAHRFIYQYNTKEKLETEDEVCHTCDIPYCVNFRHLFLGTHIDNIEDSMCKDRAFVNHGEKNGQAVLTLAIVRKIRRMSKNGASDKDISKSLSLARETVRNVTSFKTWRTSL
jgi:hypothetical protein